MYITLKSGLPYLKGEGLEGVRPEVPLHLQGGHSLYKRNVFRRPETIQRMLVVLATPATNDAISSPGVLLPPSSSGQGGILPPSSGGGGVGANQSDDDGQTSSKDRGVQRQKAFGGRRHSRHPSSSTIAPGSAALGSLE